MTFIASPPRNDLPVQPASLPKGSEAFKRALQAMDQDFKP